MDPITHVALGRTLLVLTPAARERRGTLAATLLGALAPDIDAVVMPFGWDRYLRLHEVGTHSLAGTLVCAALTAAVVRLFAGARSRLLLIAAWIGSLSHVTLDLVSGARVRPAWPLNDSLLSLPAVAMADPWLLAACVAGAVAVWRSAPHRQRTAAVASVATIAGFLLVKGIVGVVALAGYRAASDEQVRARTVEARWGSLTTWHVFDRTDGARRAWRVSATDGATQVLSWPVGDDTPLAAASRELSTVQNAERVDARGFAITLASGERTRVLWSDLRFCWSAAEAGAAQLAPVVRSSDGQTSIACAVWFGGEFDDAGRAVREIVLIGGFEQGRAVRR